MTGAGSTLWLLRHELRLGWRGVFAGRGGAKTRVFRIAALVVLALALGAVVGLPMAAAAHRTHFEPGGPYFLLVDGAAVGLFTLMLAQALNAATLVLYERNDFDLLLSSPLPAGRVLTVRALGVAVLSCSLYVALASLLVLPLAALGEARWLGVYVVLGALALAATAGGFLLAIGLFAVLGPRRTRTAAQVLAAMIGALVFLASQLRNILPHARWAALGERAAALGRTGLDPASPLTWAGRAAAGEPLPMVAAAAAGAAAFLLATRLLGRRFGADAAAAAGASPGEAALARSKARAGRVDFAGGPFRAMVRKERRLLVRDPWLISQMLLQVLYVSPMGFAIARNVQGHAAFALAAGAAAAAFVCGQLAGNLVWLTVSAEDSPELVATAPLPLSAVLRAKLVVALTPTAVLVAPPLLVLAAFSLPAAAAALLGSAAATASAAALNLWWSKPGRRRDFRRRRQASLLVGLAELVVLFAWSAATWLLVLGQPWSALPAGVALTLLLALRRPVRMQAA